MASFLDTLTNPFTGGAYDTAKGNILANIGQQTTLGTGVAGTNLAGSLAALQAGQTGALGAIGAGAYNANRTLEEAIPQATGALYGGQTAGVNALQGALAPSLADLSGGVGGATDAYNALLANTGAGDSSTSDYVNRLLGIGGGGSFAYSPADPGYQFAVDQARKTALAGANAAGMAPGGNTLDALTRLGSDYANRFYQQDVQNALGLLNTRGQIGTAAASGKANAALAGGTGAANLRTGTAGRLADLYSTTGGQVANATLGGAIPLAQLQQNAGLAAGNVYTGTGQQAAGAYGANTGNVLDLIKAGLAPASSAEMASAQGQTQGPLNLFNLVGGAATFGAGGGFNPASYSQLFKPAPVRA